MPTRLRRRYYLPALCMIALTALSALAGPSDAASGLSVPRFVSLRADEVNVRTGPGVRYPVDWVLVRRNMPIEIIAEFDTWRKVRDWQGTEGWVHQSMLSGHRTVVVTGGVRVLRREPTPDAPAVARVETGVIARLLKCDGAWCRAEASGFRGWLRRSELWGIYADEKIE